MSANKTINLPPTALTTTLSTNIFNCNVTAMTGPVGITIAQPFVLWKALYVLNKTAGAVTFSFWKGASAGNVAGTEFIGTAISVPANSLWSQFNPAGWRFDAADFWVGGASANTSLTLSAAGEIGISG